MVRLAAARVDEARAGLAQAQAGLRDAIREALASGVSAVAIADVLGVVRGRVYQLRDGTR